jgi:hypothetical protein
MIHLFGYDIDHIARTKKNQGFANMIIYIIWSYLHNSNITNWSIEIIWESKHLQCHGDFIFIFCVTRLIDHERYNEHMNLCPYYESCSWKPFTLSKWLNEIIWGYKNLDCHWHHCQFVFSPHITKIWLLTHKMHIEKKKKCWYLRFNPIDILTKMPIVTQKPKTNGQFLAPSDNATAIIDLPTTGGFAMNFYFSLFCSFNMWNKEIRENNYKLWL